MRERLGRASTPLHLVDGVRQRLLGVACRGLAQRRQRFVSKHVTGFTLVELVIVIAIVGILAAIAIPRFIDIRSEAYIAQRDAIVGSIRAGILTVAAKNQVAGGAGTFPTNLEATWNGITGGSQPSSFPSTCNAADPCFELIIANGGGYEDVNWEQATATTYTFTAPVGGGTKTYTYDNTKGTFQ